MRWWPKRSEQALEHEGTKLDVLARLANAEAKLSAAVRRVEALEAQVGDLPKQLQLSNRLQLAVGLLEKRLAASDDQVQGRLEDHGARLRSLQAQVGGQTGGRARARSEDAQKWQAFQQQIATPDGLEGVIRELEAMQEQGQQANGAQGSSSGFGEGQI